MTPRREQPHGLQHVEDPEEDAEAAAAVEQRVVGKDGHHRDVSREKGDKGGDLLAAVHGLLRGRAVVGQPSGEDARAEDLGDVKGRADELGARGKVGDPATARPQELHDEDTKREAEAALPERDVEGVCRVERDTTHESGVGGGWGMA